MPEVTLSDGGSCEVRTLGIFELDRIQREFLGPFTFEMTILGGSKKEVEYDISKYEELDRPIPEKPKTPQEELVLETEEWYQFRDWQLYQAALNHNRQRLESIAAYCDDVAAYIITHCVSPEDSIRIVTAWDWERVYKIALIPPITEKMIIQTLRDSFQASFDEQEIFDALDKTKGGSGAYNALRLFENEWANEMGYSDLELAVIPVEERARRVCAKFLRGWMEHLETDKMLKKSEAGAAN